MSDYYLAIKRNTGEAANPTTLEEIKVDESSLTMYAKSAYVMGSSQVRSMQQAIKSLISIPEYIDINKILLAHEKALRLKAEPECETDLSFYLSLK